MLPRLPRANAGSPGYPNRLKTKMSISIRQKAKRKAYSVDPNLLPRRMQPGDEVEAAGKSSAEAAHRVFGATEARIVPNGDVIQRRRVRVDEWVEESQHRFPRGEELVIHQRDDGSDTRRGRGGPTHVADETVSFNEEVPTLKRDIRVPVAIRE